VIPQVGRHRRRHNCPDGSFSVVQDGAVLRSRFSQSLQQARGPIGEQAGDGGDVGVVPMSPWGHEVVVPKLNRAWPRPVDAGPTYGARRPRKVLESRFAHPTLRTGTGRLPHRRPWHPRPLRTQNRGTRNTVSPARPVPPPRRSVRGCCERSHAGITPARPLTERTPWSRGEIGGGGGTFRLGLSS
jgi:hypothetical protein